MLNEVIAGRAPGDAGKRALPSEQFGARPEGVRPDASLAAGGSGPATRATKP